MSNPRSFYQQAVLDIQAEEDKRIMDMLIGPTCKHGNHESYGKPIRECIEPECMAEYIHSS